MGKRSRFNSPHRGPSRPKRPEIRSAPTSPTSEEASSHSLSSKLPSFLRSRVAQLALGALTIGGIGAAGATLLSESGKSQTEIVSSPPEVVDRRELMLGNVRFHFPDTAVSANNKEVIFTRIENAYNRLEGYFGKELMDQTHFAQPLDMPIILQPSIVGQNAAAEISWKLGTPVYFPKPGGDCEVRFMGETKPYQLVLGEAKERNIAHELFHLFFERAFFLSQIFTEGHATMIEDHLYGDNEDVFHQMMDKPELSHFLDIGLDYPLLDNKKRGGIENGELRNLAIIKWGQVWKLFIAQNPTFLKDFYAEVIRQKNENPQRNAFSKDELIAIASKVSPHFFDWYKEQKSFQNLPTDPPAKVEKIFSFPDLNGAAVFNFRVVPTPTAYAGCPYLEPLKASASYSLQLPAHGDQEGLNFQGITQLPDSDTGRTFYTVVFPPQSGGNL